MDLFGFFPITEDGTKKAATIACDLAHEFSRTASDYGDGVKIITVTLILTSPHDLGVHHKETQPAFNPGLRKIEAFGTMVELEDELEFSIRPEFSDINGATNKAVVANAIASALIDIHPQLAIMDIPRFDMKSFLSEIEDFFTQVGQLSKGETAGSTTV